MHLGHEEQHTWKVFSSKIWAVLPSCPHASSGMARCRGDAGTERPRLNTITDSVKEGIAIKKAPTLPRMTTFESIQLSADL